MKTASRVVGTAALLDGFEAQDSPVYGAERRGAPMAAFVRIALAPIRERGLIPAPDLVVVADDTLLDDPGTRPLAGLGPGGALLIATAHTAEEVREHTGHAGAIVARDFRALALEHVGSAAGVSAALAGASGTLLGLSEGAVTGALRTELEALGLPLDRVAANLRLAALAQAGLAPLRRAEPEAAVEAPAGRGPGVVDLAYARPERATPAVTAAPNTRMRRTGTWRVFRPVIDLDRCTRCWVCFVRCPDGAIDLGPDDVPRIDYEVCKGCLICVEECPIHAIGTVAEGRRWSPGEAA
jgi:pyruvate ferredoxin oxidoreductase gamma subunit